MIDHGDDPKGWEWLLFWTFMSGGLIWFVPIIVLLWWIL